MPPIFFLYLSLWGLSPSGVNGQGAGGDIPIGLFPLSALGLPCLRSGGGGQGRQCLAGPSVFRDGCLVPVQDFSSPLTLPGVVTTFRVCLPQAPVLRQVIVAVLAEGALESFSVLVVAFHLSLFLVGGSSDGSAPGDRFLSPGRMCLIHSVPVEFSGFCAVSIGELAFLPPLDLSVLLSDPVALSLKETFKVPMRVGSSSSLHGLSSD